MFAQTLVRFWPFYYPNLEKGKKEAESWWLQFSIEVIYSNSGLPLGLTETLLWMTDVDLEILISANQDKEIHLTFGSFRITKSGLPVLQTGISH